MIVGFTITDFKGYEQEAVEFITRVCILESPDIAKNIVNAGVDVSIFSTGVTASELEMQPFESKVIETQDGKFLLVSAVNFNLEILYNNKILRLVPTEYIYIDPSEVTQFREYLSQGLVKLIPEANEDGKAWILEKSIWDDNGVWIDSDFWREVR